MDEGRLGAVRRQQNHHRKSTIVMNDLINFQQNVYTCYLKRERQNTEAKLKAQECYVKRSIVRNSYLLQCLEARKQKIAERAPEKQILGRYGGRPIHRYSRDVDACVSWMHPRLRRLRHVERAKENGVKLGAIMDFTTIPAKMEAILENKSSEKSESFDSSTDSDPMPSPSTMSKLHRMSIRNQSFGLPNIFKNKYSIYNEQPAASNTTPETSQEVDRNHRNLHPSATTDDKRIDGILTDNDANLTLTGRISNDNNKDFQSSDNNLNNDQKTIKGKGIERENTTLNQRRQDLNLKDGGADDDGKGERSEVKTTASPSPLVRRPTLILPPIKTTKEMKTQGFDHL